VLSLYAYEAVVAARRESLLAAASDYRLAREGRLQPRRRSCVSWRLLHRRARPLTARTVPPVLGEVSQ
jgi:hypothetical protein